MSAGTLTTLNALCRSPWSDEEPQVSANVAAQLGEAGVDTVIYTLRNPYLANIIEPLGRALEVVGK